MTEYSWDLDEQDPMLINIFHRGTKVMCLFLGEAMEAAGRKEIMQHVAEIENSPWIRKWHEG
jgi:hypothetical protein